MMRKFPLLLLLFTYSCSKNYNIIPNKYEVSLQSISFHCNDINPKVCSNADYKITKTYKNSNEFTLEHNNSIFFNRNENNVMYMYEVFKSDYMLITPVTIPNNHSTTAMASRDLVYVYDFEAKKLYNFSAKKNLISAIKPCIPLASSETIANQKNKDYKCYTYVDSINITTNEIHLLHMDLETTEVLKLNPINH